MSPKLSITLLRTQSDTRLLDLCAQGHEGAFEALVERYRRPLYRFVRRMLPEARAEDVVQQTFLSAWSAVRDGAQVRDAKPWLYRIARNAALDAMRKAGYDYGELSEALRFQDSPQEDLERRMVVRRTLAGLAALPDRQREALLRTAVEGESRAEVARDLGLSEGAVRQLVHRARSTLRSAATAVTPLPAAAWLAAAAARGDEPAARIAELAAGAGAAGAAGALVKAGAVAVTAGVIAVGEPGLVRDRVERPAPEAEAAAALPATTAAAVADDRGGRGRADDNVFVAGGVRSGRSGGDDRDEDRSGRGDGDDGSGDDDRSGRRGGDDDSEDDDRSGRRGGEDHDDDDRSGRDAGEDGDDRSGSDDGDDDDRSGRGGGDRSGDDDDDDRSGSGGSGRSRSGESGPSGSDRSRSGGSERSRSGGPGSSGSGGSESGGDSGDSGSDDSGSDDSGSDDSGSDD